MYNVYIKKFGLSFVLRGTWCFEQFYSTGSQHKPGSRGGPAAPPGGGRSWRK